MRLAFCFTQGNTIKRCKRKKDMLKEIKFIGEEKFLFGIKEMQKQLCFEMKEDGDKIVCKKQGEGIHIEFLQGQANVSYERDCDFFRAFSLALQYVGEEREDICVKCDYVRFGSMQNCSTRVMSIDGIKKFIRQNALMGYNYLQLYTETSFEVPEEPYFGYMKGRFSKEELKEIVAYGKKFEVELVPCIQTLGHMSELFKWDQYYEVKDIERVMLVDYERTYQLIENMMRSLAECFDTKRINLGTDEAYFMGLGRYLWFIDKTPQDRSLLFIKHLKRVLTIAKKYGFEQPSIWYDNIFHIEFKGYSIPPWWLEAEFSKEIRESFPDVQMIFWNYTPKTPFEFTRSINMIKQLSSPVSFASMAHGYTSFAPANYITETLVEPARVGCKQNGIDDIMITWWGASLSPMALLPSYYNYIEKSGVAEGYDFNERSKFLFGYTYDEMKMLDLPNILEKEEKSTGMAEGKNPPFYILADDPLLGIMSMHVPENAEELYNNYAKKFAELAKRDAEFSYIFSFEKVLCEMLAVKCNFSKDLQKAYLAGDKATISVLADKIPLIIEKIEAFYEAYHSYWLTFNKTMGWEIVTSNVGGLILRFKTVRQLLQDYLAGKVDKIEELEQERLPYVNGAENKTVSARDWAYISTTSFKFNYFN